MNRNRILIGIDDSEGARRALEWAMTQACRPGSEILAAHVLTYSEEFMRDLVPVSLTAWRGRLRAELEGRWTAPLRRRQIPYQCILTEDDSVGGGLCRVATEHDVGLIVLGTHGHTAFKGRLLSAVTYKVSHNADRPVVVVPATWDGESSGAARSNCDAIRS